MPEHLAHQFQVSCLSKNGSSSVVPERVRPHFVRQVGSYRKPVQNVHPVASGETPLPPIHKQVILRVSVPPLREPSPEVLRCFSPKEPHPVLLPFATAHVDRASGKISRPQSATGMPR